ncbi:Pyrimidine pathway regulatory protein 1 [Meyerozyma sp. JA9]|nr:Pyrimidine pathway regulatory protein 1 [Meyerozyma sp. JA9]
MSDSSPKKQRLANAASASPLPASAVRPAAACLRCRSKKVKCDQRYPRCSRCEKVNAECVGVDPATGREVPRSYVVHLEEKIRFLESQLSGSSGEIAPMKQEFSPPVDVSGDQISPHSAQSEASASEPIPFAKLMSTALNFKSEKSKSWSQTPPQSTQMDPSSSLKHENVAPALLPPKRTAEEFLKIFFAQSNAQLPILHREEFISKYFVPIYGDLSPRISLASNYSAMNLPANTIREEDTWFYKYKIEFKKLIDARYDPATIERLLVAPEQYHKALFFLNIVFAVSSSVHHLQYPSTISDSFKVAASRYVDPVYCSADQLETLQGILLLALFATMRPAKPGIWYVLGTALRLCVDLELHCESPRALSNYNAFIRDKRRRLFWCTYSIDRQVCLYLNRPVGISDDSIETPFPSELDDALIVNDANSPADFSNPGTQSESAPSYKSVSIAFFKIRQIQSQVQRILGEKKAELPLRFSSLDSWRAEMNRQLQEWRNSLPQTQRKMNCDFNINFFHLNYFHTLIRIHGLSSKRFQLTADDYEILSDASKELINAYSSLYANKSINYTWAAVHNMFMAGTSYLYAVYNSNDTRNTNSVFEVKKITQECITILHSLIDRCVTAWSCIETLKLLSAVVLKIRYNETVYANMSRMAIPSTQQIAKSQPAGYVNSNLQHLIAALIEHENINSSVPQELDQHQTHTVQQAKPESIDQVTPFEWISESNLEGLAAEEDPNSLDIKQFLNQLESASDVSSISGRESLPGYKPFDGTPVSNQTNDSYNSSPANGLQSPQTGRGVQQAVQSRDAKRTFEMMNKVTADSIWDEFFTSQTVGGFGINEGLIVEE